MWKLSKLLNQALALGTYSSRQATTADEQNPAEAGCQLGKPTSLPLRRHLGKEVDVMQARKLSDCARQ